MDWWREFAEHVRPDVPLAPLTWFGLGGAAELLAEPVDVDELARLRFRAREAGVPFRVLGRGANVLVRDEGVAGVVVRLTAGAFCEERAEGEALIAGAGVDLMQLVRRCCRDGLGGLEGLAGIPATVGGAVRMNAGGRYGAFGDRIARVTVLTPDGRIETRGREELKFGYRSAALGDDIVLSAHLALDRQDPEALEGRYRRIWNEKRAAQPMADHSAGCIFKNPPGAAAGALIDRAGCKGMTEGAARVSDRHANFIVAARGAAARDVRRLAERVRATVEQRFGVELEYEVEFW